MYKIEKTSYGVKMIFRDVIEKSELMNWLSDSKNILDTLSDKFGVLVDMRELLPLTAESQLILQEGQKLYKEKGMERSVVILNSPILTIQIKRLSKATGIYAFERYIDSSKHSDWEEMAKEWIENAKDCDQ